MIHCAQWSQRVNPTGYPEQDLEHFWWSLMWPKHITVYQVVQKAAILYVTYIHGFISLIFDHFRRDTLNRFRNTAGNFKYCLNLFSSNRSSGYRKIRDLMCRMHGFDSLKWLSTSDGTSGIGPGTLPSIWNIVWAYFVRLLNANRSSDYWKCCNLMLYTYTYTLTHKDIASIRRAELIGICDSTFWAFYQ